MRHRQAAGLAAALAVLTLLATGCSGVAQQTEPDDKDLASAAQKPRKPKAPTKGLVKVVYSAKATEESNQRIDSAVQMALAGQNNDALQSLNAVLSNDDQAYLAAYNLGVLYDRMGRVDKATAAYERALMIEADFSPALLNLVRLEARTGSKAVSTADIYIDKRPDNLEHRLVRLDALVAEERHNEAIEDARLVLKEDEANVRARYYLALAHFGAGRVRLAQYITEQGLEIDDSDPELQFLHGQVLLELDEEAGSRRAFESAVTLRPLYPEAQNALGLLQHRSRNFAEAEASFEMALQADPLYKEAFLNLGNALKAQGRGDDAADAYRAALELAPKWSEAHFSLGTLYLASELVPLSKLTGLERLEKAKAELIEARELATDEEGSTLAGQFIAKADKAIQIMQAELELERMEKEPGGADPFGEGGGDDADPFGDEGGSADPFDDAGGDKTAPDGTEAPPADGEGGDDPADDPADDPVGDPVDDPVDDPLKEGDK